MKMYVTFGRAETRNGAILVLYAHTLRPNSCMAWGSIQGWATNCEKSKSYQACASKMASGNSYNMETF